MSDKSVQKSFLSPQKLSGNECEAVQSLLSLSCRRQGSTDAFFTKNSLATKRLQNTKTISVPKLYDDIDKPGTKGWNSEVNSILGKKSKEIDNEKQIKVKIKLDTIAALNVNIPDVNKQAGLTKKLNNNNSFISPEQEQDKSKKLTKIQSPIVNNIRKCSVVLQDVSKLNETTPHKDLVDKNQAEPESQTLNPVKSSNPFVLLKESFGAPKCYSNNKIKNSANKPLPFLTPLLKASTNSLQNSTEMPNLTPESSIKHNLPVWPQPIRDKNKLMFNRSLPKPFTAKPKTANKESQTDAIFIVNSEQHETLQFLKENDINRLDLLRLIEPEDEDINNNVETPLNNVDKNDDVISVDSEENESARVVFKVGNEVTIDVGKVDKVAKPDNMDADGKDKVQANKVDKDVMPLNLSTDSEVPSFKENTFKETSFETINLDDDNDDDLFIVNDDIVAKIISCSKENKALISRLYYKFNETVEQVFEVINPHKNKRLINFATSLSQDLARILAEECSRIINTDSGTKCCDTEPAVKRIKSNTTESSVSLSPNATFNRKTSESPKSPSDLQDLLKNRITSQSTGINDIDVFFSDLGRGNTPNTPITPQSHLEISRLTLDAPPQNIIRPRMDPPTAAIVSSQASPTYSSEVSLARQSHSSQPPPSIMTGSGQHFNSIIPFTNQYTNITSAMPPQTQTNKRGDQLQTSYSKANSRQYNYNMMNREEQLQFCNLSQRPNMAHDNQIHVNNMAQNANMTRDNQAHVNNMAQRSNVAHDNQTHVNNVAPRPNDHNLETMNRLSHGLPEMNKQQMRFEAKKPNDNQFSLRQFRIDNKTPQQYSGMYQQYYMHKQFTHGGPLPTGSRFASSNNTIDQSMSSKKPVQGDFSLANQHQQLDLETPAATKSQQYYPNAQYQNKMRSYTAPNAVHQNMPNFQNIWYQKKLAEEKMKEMDKQKADWESQLMNYPNSAWSQMQEMNQNNSFS